jgi:lysophospholipid acyltransferase (LPLAT)-like uncharacterized protein
MRAMASKSPEDSQKEHVVGKIGNPAVAFANMKGGIQTFRNVIHS